MIYKITEQQVQDYISCPVYYDYKYNSSLDIAPPKTLPKLLNKVTSGFFLKMIDGILLTPYDLKRKWDMVCRQNMDFIDSKRNLEGIAMLNNMYRWAENEQLVVSGEQIPYTYEIPYKDKVVIALSGVLRTIISNKKNNFEYLIIDYGNKLPDQAMLDIDLKTTMDCVVFEKMYKKPILGCRIHNVKYNKDYFTHRSRSDFNRLDKALKGIVSGIENNAVYPRQSPLCSSCRIKDLCIGWGALTWQ